MSVQSSWTIGIVRTYIAGELSPQLASLFDCCLRWWQTMQLQFNFFKPV